MKVILPTLRKAGRYQSAALALPAPDFDLRALLLAGPGTPTVALPPDVQAALNRQDWTLAGSSYDLLRDYLARRVAYTSEVGQPRRIDEEQAKATIAETTIDMALAPRHYSVLHDVLSLMESVNTVAQRGLAQMRDELKQQGMLE